jgi:LL-diaminopimelate aminotransferase
MALINENFYKLRSSYLFPEVRRRVAHFTDQRPGLNITNLGMGDVVLPLASTVTAAMKAAVEELESPDTFKGYGPVQGYDFLRNAILEQDYASRGVQLSPDEIFISEGSKSDCGNLQELFSVDARVAIADPVYPVYVDSNVMAGRTGVLRADRRYERLVYLPCREETGFVPEPPSETVDFVYLCSPNNPTGAVMNRQQLTDWVRWAQRTHAILLFDAAYEAFIGDADLPHSIYEIDGARVCAIEMRSFSKSAGFTGVRCGFTVIPKDVMGYGSDGKGTSLHSLWSRRYATKYNGTSYIVQRGAAAVYTPAGRKETSVQVAFYMDNARIMRQKLLQMGFQVWGGENAPYVWMATKGSKSSWDFFDRMLAEALVIGTPGIGFGPSGEGYYRLSAFSMREGLEDALIRIERAFG